MAENTYSDIEYADVIDTYNPNPQILDQVIVTSSDIAAWNQISALSAISGIENLSALSAFKEISTSADTWNDTYSAVSNNSANWNSANSGVNELRDTITILEDAIRESYKIYTNDEFTGNGTSADPLGLKTPASAVSNQLQKLTALAMSAFKNMDIAQPNWVSNEEHDRLITWVRTIEEKNTEQDMALSSHWIHIEEILRHLRALNNKTAYVPAVVTEDNYKSLSANDTMYYSYYM